MNSTLALGITDKVSAISYVLSAIGMGGISSEEDIDYNIDAGDADKLIDNLSQTTQTNGGKGFWFNREEFHKLEPSSTDGKVKVPSNTMSCFYKEDGGKPYPITMRGQYLFDTKELGYDMRSLVRGDGKLHCTLIVNLPFETLPPTAKQHIADLARYWMVNDKEGDQIKLAALEKQAVISRSALDTEEGSQRRRNMFNNPSVRYAMGRIGGYNNN
ncbi:tail fibers protein [Marinomonas phage CB5A]|uniref:Tail fibers protein n=3 Tax=Murciavirus TaxID=2731675 RepID=A0A1W5S120_9CAUD|nr:tail fibers protein [Marinomonas phage CPP1m]YP_009791127.1 tail fibers protein [Marinomonas phage CB5A]ARB11254.1 tail fibers protein [Marinomonas phage CPP1m]ARB11304.1 tail fibers protein [Marinomonas phage CPG1g]ASP46298.1 tail fibers protein [Marinomonas phage CB5A]